MTKKIKYTDEPMKVGERIKDFLPPPGQLVKRDATTKITLEVTQSSLDFFKKQAQLADVPYQRMMRSLLDAYAHQYESSSR